MEFQELKYKPQLDPEEAVRGLDKPHTTCYIRHEVKA